MHRKEAPKEILGLTRITKKRILELCRKDKLYQTPELNDVLYLHYQGFDGIECLEDYTELKCLWLECNAISEIQGLEKQSKLKCLFLQSNLIRKIENLEYCKELDTLNLSQNHIRKIENCGIDVLPVLNSLNLSSNYIRDCEGLNELKNCKNLSVLDLSNNRIDDILIVKIFALMPELKVLIMQGNPVVSKIPQYRKTLILECKNLTYLDSRPVFAKDRACAEAWKRGGYEEERKENERWNRKERKKIRDSVNATINLRNKNRKLEDRISLLASSDSEDDANKQKKNMRIPGDSEVRMHDSIWDEVAEEKMSEVTSASDTSADSQKSESSQSSENGSDEEPIVTNIQDIDGDVQAQIEVQQTEEEERIEEMIQANLSYGLERIVNEDKDFQVTNKNDSDADHQENYDTTIEAIGNITKSEDISEYSFETQNENPDTIEENYEPLKELEEAMNIFSQKATYDESFCQFETKAVKSLESEQECSKVNQQVETDFEELTKNLSNFVNQLEKEQEERQEVIKALFTKEISAKESSSERSSSSEEEEDTLKNLKLERMVDQWDSKSQLKKGTFGRVTQRIMNREQIKINYTENEISENIGGTRSSALNNGDVENTDRMRSAGVFEYMPLDVSSLTRKSNEALNSLERESNELKRLLQKLENNNEELYKDLDLQIKYSKDGESCEEQEKHSVERNLAGSETEDDHSLHTNVQEDIKEHKQEDLLKYEGGQEEDHTQIASTIVKEILHSLDFTHFNNKSYEFPDDLTEYEEQCDLSFKMDSQPETSSKNIPEFIETFSHFFDEVEVNKQKESNIFFENLDKQKSRVLKELSTQTNLKEFNNDTLESLDAQLEEIRRKQHVKVRRMVDRVYAQKDRYDDTLELVDGQLMVRNKETKELKELPQSKQQDLSDSEEDYDTAHSEEEGKNVNENLRREPIGRRPFKPIARKSSEDLIIRALIENNPNRSNDSSEESDDEFYSLDSHDKQTLYNIDQEFLNKLKFDFSNLTQMDENHIVQCARSYDELKPYLTLSKEERCLTEEENQLVENMVITPRNSSDLSKAEQLWLNKVKSQERLKIQASGSTSHDEDHKYKFEKNSEQIMENTLLRNILEYQEIDESLNDKRSQELFDRQSEEEKNEIESNIDIESCTTNAKLLDCKEKSDISKDKSEEEILTESPRDEDTVLKKSVNNSCNVEVVECNMEIIGDNDEIVDTITVNAELHF